MEVEPGLSFIQLNNVLKEKGFYFPLDAGPAATIGGMIANNASGTRALRYGAMRDNVISMQVVLSNGKVVTTSSLSRKTSAAYNLNALIVGSEGTLAIVCRATIKMHKIPTFIFSATFSCPNLRKCAEIVTSLIQQKEDGVELSSVSMLEILDEVMIEALNRRFKLGLPIEPTVYLEIGCNSQQSLKAQKEGLERLVEKSGGNNLKLYLEEEERDSLLKARKAALFCTEALRPDEKDLKICTTDTCVPISRLAEMMSETKEDLKKSFLFG